MAKGPHIQHVYSRCACQLTVKLKESLSNERLGRSCKDCAIFMGDHYFLIYMDSQIYMFRSTRRFDMVNLNTIYLHLNNTANVLQVSLPCSPRSEDEYYEEGFRDNEEIKCHSTQLKNITVYCLLQIAGEDPVRLDACGTPFRGKFISFECHELDAMARRPLANHIHRTVKSEMEEIQDVPRDQCILSFVTFLVPDDLEKPKQYTNNFKGFISNSEEKCMLHNLVCQPELMDIPNESEEMQNEGGLTSLILGVCCDDRSPLNEQNSESAYTSTVLSGTLSFMDSQAKVRGNEKEFVKQIIRLKVAAHKSNLVQVKELLEDKFQKSLSNIDDVYVERNYIKCLSKVWLKEITDTLKNITDNKNGDTIRLIFNSLHKVVGLKDVPSLFKGLQCYELLMDHYKMVNENHEKALIIQFRKQCWEQAISYSERAKNELEFLKTLVDLLKASPSLRSLIVRLALNEFCGGASSFDELLERILDLDVSTYGRNVAALQGAAKHFQQEGSFFLIDTFKEVLGVYAKPVEIHERKIDSLSVAEVKGSVIIISDILQELQDKLSGNSNIAEVRFVAADMVHIDRDLNNEIWHGMNIVILTNTMKIHGDVTWNVSGMNNIHTFSSNAGTGQTGHGTDGSDGCAGESGGNVLILAELIQSPETFTIISNGGVGSKGQDGGDGKNGEDGRCIGNREFRNRFPSVVKLSFERTADLVDNIVCKIKQDAFISEISRGNGNCFIKAYTHQGNEIIFSFCCPTIINSIQAYFLYKGALGKPGGHGGEHGLGGQGGFSGEIVVSSLLRNGQEFDVIRIANYGNDGENGREGLYGKHGKDGWDMGYLDYQFWSKAKFYGEDQNSKLKQEYFDLDNKPSNRVWCPHVNKYVGITTTTIENKKNAKYEERKSSKQNYDRQHRVQAVRKKDISQSSILASNSNHLRPMEEKLMELRSDLENVKQSALGAITESQQQREKQTTKAVEIARYGSSTQQVGRKRSRYTKPPSAHYKDTGTYDDLIDRLQVEALLLDNWLALKDAEIARSELKKIFTHYETVRSSFREELDTQHGTETSNLKTVENLLISKYELATLQEIATLLPSCSMVANPTELTPESAARYLVEDKEKDTDISHPTLGTLHQYLYQNTKEQHEKIFKFYRKAKNNKFQFLKNGLNTFILEVGQSAEAHLCIKKYYNEYKTFIENQELNLNVFFEAFKSELSQPRHAELSDLWIESIKDKTLKTKLEGKIQEDDFLKPLYSRCIKPPQLDSNKCCKDQTVRKEYWKHIRERGPLSASYRELLAYTFGINIRLYGEDENNALYLQDNHNPTAKKSTHILCRSATFVQLTIDEDYLRLEEQRRINDSKYAQIFVEIDSLKRTAEFDEYLKKQSFLRSKEYTNISQSVYDEDGDIRQIIDYFSGEERQQLEVRLEKIKAQYVGQQGILHNILQRFSNEGRHVSCQELCFLINSIISSCVEERKEQATFCWIVRAYSQKSWIDELLLLHLENYFRKPLAMKSKMREHLLKIENIDTLLLLNTKLDQYRADTFVSTQSIEEILRLLSSIPKEAVLNLEGLQLPGWSYALKERYWTSKLSKLMDWQRSDLPTASYYLLSLENTFGSPLVEHFTEILKDKTQKLFPNMLINILSNFHAEGWTLSESVIETLRTLDVSKWQTEMDQKLSAVENDRDVAKLVEIIKNNGNTSKGICDNLPTIEGSLKSICGGKPVDSFSEQCITDWAHNFKCNNNKDNSDTEMKMLAVVDRAIELTRGFKLRDTQRLTVLALLTNTRNTLAQVSTGEGKSLIVVVLSIMKALCGQKVDIVTSSSVLAKRDAEENTDIYALFDISVSHISSEDIDKRKAAYSGCQVVYGDLSNFQRDYLLDTFYGKHILGDRHFECVIVDEVDSMLLDKGNNMLYLSHVLAGLDKLESLYIYIWQWINRPAKEPADIFNVFDSKAIKEAVLNDLYGLVKREDIGRLDSVLNELQTNTLYERLIKAELLDDQGVLLGESVDDTKLSEVLSPEFIKYKDRLGYLFKECFGRERRIHVPNYLRPFIERHLESWIENAKIAFFLKSGLDYVVDVDRTGSNPDRNPIITILDRDTGTDQVNCLWEEALHQFLQLKHGCKLSLQSLKAVFISNVSFFKLYRDLHGLTGTLGSQRERDLLQEMHKVDFVTIPTYTSKKFIEHKPFICTNREEWINCIHDSVQRLTETRSVLVICETVNDVEILHKVFAGRGAKNVHTYTRDYEVFDLAKGSMKLEKGHVIIATNLAGRGTDIKITEELERAGGLHVCLTYLPNNIRIEQQAFGRASRSGDRGSGQLIIMHTRGQGYRDPTLFDLRKDRNTEELYRISAIKADYETQIIVEEECFEVFKDQYEELKNRLKEKRVPSEVTEILLQSCLDKWSFWLDENGKRIRNLIDEQNKRSFYCQMYKFMSQLQQNVTGHCVNSWLASVKGNPVQMIKLGKYLSQTKNDRKRAIGLFDEVIRQEPYFSAAAHYYKAFALARLIDWEQKPIEEDQVKRFKIELREAARLFEEHCKFAVIAAGIVGKIKKHNNDSIIQIDAYEQQQNTLANLYYTFSRSVDNVFGYSVTSQSFINHDIKEEIAETIYEDLLEEFVLEKPRVKKSVSQEKLRVISSSYGVSAETLKAFLSKYQGCDINWEEFLTALKKAVQLPSRELFWKTLLKQRVISEEFKYIIVDNDKLAETDRSLLDKKRLKSETLKSNHGEIFLKAELIGVQETNIRIFEKVHFVESLGRDKYMALKKKGVLSSNRKARVDKMKAHSASFPNYDSIGPDDLAMLDIAKNEAELILADLVERKVIQKSHGSQNDGYRLHIQYDEIEEILLTSCPVYENGVKALLYTCFAYRLALQRLLRQLNENIYPVFIQLMTKPHRSLVSELLVQRIVRPVAVEIKDVRDKLYTLYGLPTTKDNCVDMLSRSRLLPQEYPMARLVDHLVEKGWLSPYCPKQHIKEDGIKAAGSAIVNVVKSLRKDRYTIASAKDRKPLEESYQNIENSLNMIFDRRVQLAKEDTIKHIIACLERSRCVFKSLEVPEAKLKPFSKAFAPGEFGNMEEVYVFLLNGLDHLLQLEEKQWTRGMLINLAMITAMGIVQLSVGVAIELFSVGVMTHCGTALVAEGFSDLVFAGGALVSGYCSWNDYSQYKLESLVLQAFIFGIAAFMSRGTKFSRFGHKLAAPNLEVGGTKVAETCGKQLIQAVGGNAVGKQVARRIVLKTMQGIVVGIANASADKFVENYIWPLCEGVSSSILSDVEQMVEDHMVTDSLEEAYKKMGPVETRLMVKDLNQRVFSEMSFKISVSRIFKKISAAAIEKISRACGNFKVPIRITSQVDAWSKMSEHSADILKAVGVFLDTINDQIKCKLERDSIDQQEDIEIGYAKFKEEVVDEWKLLLRKQVGQLTEQHIVTPILKESTRIAARYLGGEMQEAYQYSNESAYRNYFDRIKQENREELQIAGVQRDDHIIPTPESHIREKYHTDLLKLLAKTSSPKLFADIVRENIPMDMTCVGACTQVVHTILEERGLTGGLTVVVEAESGIRQRFSTTPEGVNAKVVRLNLVDNHFHICGSGISKNKNNTKDNCCLYEALTNAIPELRNLTPQNFRDRACHHIEQDQGIQEHIRQGWHRIPLSGGAYGGAAERDRYRIVHDPQTPSLNNEGCGERNNVLNEVRSKAGHIYDRLKSFVHVAKTYVSKETLTHKNELSEGAPSKCQDKSSTRGKGGTQAAHAVYTRVQPKLEFGELKTILSHAQNALEHANWWNFGGVGGIVDTFQTHTQKKLMSIDFSRSLTAEDASTLQSLKDDYIKELDLQDKGKHGRQEVLLAHQKIMHMTIENLF